MIYRNVTNRDTVLMAKWGEKKKKTLRCMMPISTVCLGVSLCRLPLGYPLPEVQWLQDDKPLSESSRVKMQYGEDGHCSLVVSGVEASDAGVYVCRASNQLGAASCSARLEVDT